MEAITRRAITGEAWPLGYWYYLHADAEEPDANEDMALQDAFEHVILILRLACIDLIEHLQATRLCVITGDYTHKDPA